MTEVPQVDHRICQAFECVVQLTEAIEAKQQVLEFIFAAEHSLNAMEPLVKDSRVEQRLATSLNGFSSTGIGVDIGNHPAIKNGFPIHSTIVDAIQTNDGSSKVKANSLSDSRHQRQGFSQEWRFIAIAGSLNKRRDHITTTIAEGDDLVAFHLLVSAKTYIVAAFLCRCRRAIAVDDGGVEEIALMKLSN